MTRTKSLLTTLVVAATVIAAAPAHTHARRASFAPACVSADLSPSFAADGRGFCVAFDPSDGGASTFRFFTTRDGGGTFERRAAAGFSTTPDDRIGSVIASPGYESDRTVFVQTSKGVFATNDDGDTFTLLDGVASPGASGPNLSAYVESSSSPASQTEEPRPILVFAAGDASMKIDPPLRVPVAGAPLDERRFLFPTGGFGEWSAYTMTLEIDRTGEARSRNVLFGCNDQLVCNDQLFAFPWGHQFEPRGGIWFAPDFEDSDRVYVTTSKLLGAASPMQAWRSVDAGATFRPWRSVNRILRPLRHLDRSRPIVGLATNASRPRTIYMRVSYYLSIEVSARRTPPVERLFVSRDRGRTWDRVAHRREDRQNGSPGTIPWDGPWGYPDQSYMSLTGDGKLFVMAKELGGHSGLYCSTDGGRTWAPLCPSE